MSDSESDDAITSPCKWPIERIRLLIQLRLDMEPLFRSGRSRHLLWPQIYAKLKTADPSMTETLKNVQKKFNNLMLTYKRIKSSARNLNQSRWEFFDDFNDILSQLGETPDENEQSNVRYVKVEKVDDDSVSFSSDDDGDASSNYKNVVTYKPKLPVTPAVKHTVPIGNGIKSEHFSVVHVKGPESDTKKRKLTETGATAVVSKVQIRNTNSSTESKDDEKSWFREYVEINERNEQRRYEQQEQLLELERKRIEIETRNGQTLRELLDVVKKFVNK